MKNGNAKGKEGTDFTYTKSGSEITIVMPCIAYPNPALIEESG